MRSAKENGHPFIGIRLDSGDLCYLSIEARKKLDAAGFPEAHIFASNELDEHVIRELKQDGAQITVWGVGTNLVTAKDQPALDGVYKLTALKDKEGQWQHKIKLSEQMLKVSNPGLLQVRRYTDAAGGFVADAIIDEIDPPTTRGELTVVDPLDSTRRKVLPEELSYEDLLVPIFRSGNLVYEVPSLKECQSHAQQQVNQLHSAVLRLLNPHQYVAGLEQSLYEKKLEIVSQLRKQINEGMREEMCER